MTPVPRDVPLQLISPKLDYLAHSKEADAHTELMLSPVFRRACEVALAEMTVALTTNRTPAEMSLVGIQLAGARMFARTLMNLGLPTVPEARREGLPDNLIPT